jgi:hypothetical protein
MSEDVPTKRVPTETERRKSIIIVSAVAGAVLLGVVGVSLALANAPLVLTANADPSASPSSAVSPSASPDSSVAPSSTPTPGPSASFDAQFGEDVIDNPGAGATDAGTGVTTELVALSDTTVTGTGIGETSGPAAKVVLRLVNTTGAEVSIDTVTVNAYAADGTPLSPVSSDSAADWFEGTLASGGTTDGTYLFSANSSSSVVVTVSLGADSPLVVFGR